MNSEKNIKIENICNSSQDLSEITKINLSLNLIFAIEIKFRSLKPRYKIASRIKNYRSKNNKFYISF